MRSIDTLMVEGKAKPKRRRSRGHAPDLAAFVERAVVGGPGPRPTSIAAKEQLQHLEAVARAAFREADRHSFDRPCSCTLCQAVQVHLVEPKRQRKTGAF